MSNTKTLYYYYLLLLKTVQECPKYFEIEKKKDFAENIWEECYSHALSMNFWDEIMMREILDYNLKL